MSNDLPALNTSLVLTDQAPKRKGKGAKPPTHWFKLATALIEKCELNSALKYDYEILLSAWNGHETPIAIEDCFDRDLEDEEFYLWGSSSGTSWVVDRLFKDLDHDASEIMRDMQAVWPGFNVFSLSRPFISARLKRMIGTVSGARLSIDYADMLINYIEMQNPCALALETACREIEQTVKKLPVPGDVLPVLKKHSDEWAKIIDPIKAWHDGTLKKRVEETLVALRERERIHLKQVRGLLGRCWACRYC